MEDGGALGARAEEEPKKKRGQRGRKAPQRSFCRRDPPNDDRERGGTILDLYRALARCDLG
jgi:hypothetical protein